MFVKLRSSVFVDNLTIEMDDVLLEPIQVMLRSEDGKIYCKTEKSVHPKTRLINWDGLNDLPYGIYTLQCSQGNDSVEVRMVKRV